jgi:hypothetical protein
MRARRPASLFPCEAIWADAQRHEAKPTRQNVAIQSVTWRSLLESNDVAADGLAGADGGEGCFETV